MLFERLVVTFDIRDPEERGAATEVGERPNLGFDFEGIEERVPIWDGVLFKAVVVAFSMRDPEERGTATEVGKRPNVNGNLEGMKERSGMELLEPTVLEFAYRDSDEDAARTLVFKV